jgi:polyphenol oxidase
MTSDPFVPSANSRSTRPQSPKPPGTESGGAISRRGFIHGAGAAAFVLGGMGAGGPSLAQTCTFPTGAVIPFATDTNLPIRVRRRIDSLDAVEQTRLKTAFAALKLLTTTAPQDPRGWMAQADVHCWYCGQSGTDIHGSWFFYPWHRAYLYFYERILGALINDMSFTLPYWPWDTLQHLPDDYHDATLSLNPLFDSLRIRTNTSQVPSSVANTRMLQDAMLTRQRDVFLGSAPNAIPQNTASLEATPHGSIHNWIGGINPPRPDMSLFRTAARDPVFFTHHSQIDRLWTMWVGQPQRFNHSDPAWLNQTWDFIDENQRLVRISVRNVLDHENELRYRYDDVSISPGVVPSPGSISGSTTTLATISVDEPPGGRALGPMPITFTVDLSLDDRTTLLAARPEFGRAVNLEIEGIEVPADSAAVIKIFLNQPAATAATLAEDPGFLTTLSFVASSDQPQPMQHGKQTVSLDISDRIPSLLLTVTPLQVTLAPTNMDDAPPDSISLQYDALRLRVVQVNA